MAMITVHTPNCEDFDNLGECGPLECISAKFIEEANGLSELTIEHPIDKMGRWSFLQEGYILQAEVPVRTVPEIKDGAIVTQTQTWKVKTTATKSDRALYSKASGGRKLATVDIWKDKAKTIRNTVVVVAEDDSRYKIRRNKGYGYISKNALEEAYSNPPLNQTPEAIETIVPAWSIRPQLFRMYAPEIDEKKVTVKARHISYDLLGNIVTYDPSRTHPNWSSTKQYQVGDVVYDTNTKRIHFCAVANINHRPPAVYPTPPNIVYWTDNPTCSAALSGIMRNCGKPHEFSGATNIAVERVIKDWIDVSPIEALLDPENGIVNLWKADLVRDNWELTLLDDAGLNRGIRIEYGKNLTGIKASLDTSDLITSIKPIGQTNKGKPLYLAAGTYTVDGQTVVVDSSLTVSSPHEIEYPVPHVYTMNLGDAAKAASTSSGDVLAARKKMIKACLDKFTHEKCDLPLLTLRVEFIALDSTEEYKQYKQLERVYLFDRVTVWHPKIGVDVLTSVRRIEFDPIKDAFIKIELGPVRRNATMKKIPSWKLPPAQQVAYGAVSVGDISDDAGALSEISSMSTLTEINSAVYTGYIESTSGDVLENYNADVYTTLIPHVFQNGIEITDTIDPARFSWFRATGNLSEDQQWALAHVGLTRVEDVCAAEWSMELAIYSCVIADPVIPEE